MAYSNTIALFKQYITLLDEVYKAGSLTADLDGNNELVRLGANANELVIPKRDMDGLATYSRNNGYTDGAVSLTYETIKCNFDRGRLFQIDVMDNQETMGVILGNLSSQFVRERVIPELDAFRFATYASTTGIGTTDAASLTSGSAVVSALRAAISYQDDKEVSPENRILYITSALKGLVDDLDTTKSRAVLSRFSKIITVPQSRFYTAITQYDGKTSGQEKGGYVKATGAQDINFMVIQKDAPIQFVKHTDDKIVTPEANNNANAWKIGYRNLSIADVYENKVAGIYLHKAPVPTSGSTTQG